jgi:hypothetical protein
MNIFQPTISGSLFISGAVESGGSGHIVTINTSSGLISFTSSNAIGGGGSGAGFPFVGTAIISGSLVVTGSGVVVTGSISSTGGFTGSLFGTSSWAVSASQAITASYARFAEFLVEATSSVIGDGAATSYTITHNFGTRNLHITVYESGSNFETVYPDIQRPTVNTATIVFANPPTSLNPYIVYISI